MHWHERQTHLRLNAAFNIAYGLFNLFGALTLFLLFGGLGALVGAIGLTTLALPAVLVGVLFVMVAVLGAVSVSLPFLLNLVAAYGLVEAPNAVWTVVASVIAAALMLPVFPLGTLLGAHTLLVVFWDALPGLTSRVRRLPA